MLTNLLDTPSWTWPLPGYAVVALAAWLGACFGSFSNVLIYRLPRNLSIVGPRSFCPQCGKTVAWYDNIPLLSWIVLGARCRHCKAPIPLRYFLLEAAGAACPLLGVGAAGWTMAGLGVSLFLLLLLDIAVIDWEHMIIPHTLTVTGIILGLAISLFASPGLPRAVLGCLVGGGIILTVSWGYKLVRGVVGMGGGDVMLMGMVGAFLGPWKVLAVLFGGALLGTLFVILAGRGRINGESKLPFGTFLALAAGLVMFFGDGLLRWYVARF